jgi:hypothetical protein
MNCVRLSTSSIESIFLKRFYNDPLDLQWINRPLHLVRQHCLNDLCHIIAVNKSQRLILGGSVAVAKIWRIITLPVVLKLVHHFEGLNTADYGMIQFIDLHAGSPVKAVPSFLIQMIPTRRQTQTRLLIPAYLIIVDRKLGTKGQYPRTNAASKLTPSHPPSP